MLVVGMETLHSGVVVKSFLHREGMLHLQVMQHILVDMALPLVVVGV